MKSLSSTLIELWARIYQDSCSRCGVEQQPRDLETLRSRVEDEGLSFMTITLPSFYDDVLTCVEKGRFDPSLFRSFRKSGLIPAFLQGITSKIFNVDEGGTVGEEISDYLMACQQSCTCYKKLRLGCSKGRTLRAFDKYELTNEEINAPISGIDYAVFRKLSRILWTEVLGDFNAFDLNPGHGPGQTSDRKTTNSRYRWLEWPRRAADYFPILGTALSIGAVFEQEFQQIAEIDSDTERPVKVISVPKTLKTPRIIAMEPSYMQYMQQSISRWLYKRLENHELTAGHVNFTDQSINRSIALTSSSSGEFATLDLSDASDRVPAYLVKAMFSGVPHFRDALFACRSMRANVNGKIISLNRFASMGSSTCFPVEAMYFYTICVIALLSFYKLVPSKKNIRFVTQRIYVYGDDILVPVETTPTVVDHLTRYYCHVNARKSFSNSKYRESCGMVAYNGRDITTIYVREPPLINRQSEASIVISTFSLMNQLYHHGLWSACQLICDKLEAVYGKLPYVSSTSSALGRHSVQNWNTYQRWNKRLMRFEIKALTIKPVKRRDPISGYAALTKFFINRFSEPVKLNLEQTERRNSVTLKSCWVTPY